MNGNLREQCLDRWHMLSVPSLSSLFCFFGIAPQLIFYHHFSLCPLLLCITILTCALYFCVSPPHLVSLIYYHCCHCRLILSDPACVLAEQHESVSVCFSDLVGFTGLSEQLRPVEVSCSCCWYHVLNTFWLFMCSDLVGSLGLSKQLRPVK